MPIRVEGIGHTDGSGVVQDFRRVVRESERTKLERRLWLRIEEAGLPEPIKEHRFAAALGRQFRADGFYPPDLLIEVEGGIWAANPGRHNRGSGFEEDCRKYSLAAVLGFRVIRLTERMIRSGEAVDLIKAALQTRSTQLALTPCIRRSAVVIHIGFEDRDPDTPPIDSLAEAMVLNYLLNFPERLGEFDLTALLQFPEHRMILAALEQAYRPGESWPRFYLRWIDACEQQAHGLSGVLDGCAQDFTRWDLRRVAGDAQRGSSLDVDWWYARLQRVATSRQLIADAQMVAERAWRGDVEGALQAVGRIQESGVVRVEI